MRGTLLTLLALGTTWAGLPAGTSPLESAPATIGSQEGTTATWLVSGTADCRIGLDQGAGNHSFIVMGGSCGDAPALLLKARSWKADSRDEIAMLDDEGSEILRFGQDENGGLISTEPRSVLVGLSPAGQD